jgi:Tol biopolymer transport system component
LLLPEVTQFNTAFLSPKVIAISPDGTRIAYAANSRLFLRPLNEKTEPWPIPGTGETGLPVTPVFSPDGQSLAYVGAVTSQGPFSIKIVPVTGGTPTRVFESKPTSEAFVWGLTWPTQESLVFVSSDGVVRMPLKGGTSEVLVERGEDEVFESPQILPGGNQVLFVRLAGAQPGEAGVLRWDTAEIVIQSIGKTDRTTIWKGGSHPRYLPTGQIVFARGNTLFALSVDLDSREVTGGPFPVLEGVRRTSDGFTDAAQNAVSDTGLLVSIPTVSVAQENGILALLDRRGLVKTLPVRPAQYRSPRFSPDGSQIAVEIVDAAGQSNIWIYHVEGKSEIRRLTQQGNNTRPIWNPDGKHVTFGSNRDGSWGVYQQPADDGAALAVRLTTAKSAREHYPDSWSPNGKTLVFVEAVTPNNTDLWTLSTDSGETALLVGEAFNQFGSAFSPDGKWLLYTDAATPFGLRAKAFPPTGVVQQITQEGEGWPIWSSADEIIFRLRRDGNQPPQLRVIDVTTTGGFNRKNPRTLPIPKEVVMYQGYRDYDATQDGGRFVIILAEEKATPVRAPTPRIDIVLNWFAELSKRIQSP